MSQNLPIQGPQVQEIQGGVRLTPLGLRQLSSEANLNSMPNGGPAAMADPGDGNTTTLSAHSHAPLQPAKLVYSIPNQNHTGVSTYSLALTDYGFTITSVEYIVLEAGHGSNNEVKVVTPAGDAVTIDTASSTANLALPSTKITYNSAHLVTAKGGTLSITAKGGAANKTAGIIILNGFVNS